jgi:hypothetical protein
MTSFGGTWPYFRLSLIDLARSARLDVFPDCIAHTFLVHHRSQCLFKMQVPRVLEVMVIPTDCPVP